MMKLIDGKLFCIILLVTVVRTQELILQNYDYNSQQLRQYLEEVSPAPTKKGPVLFPNDGPPPPRTPLVVTSRPLIESIARSELNNSIAESSYVNPVSYSPYGSKHNFKLANSPQEIPQYHNDISSEQDYSEGQNYAFSYIVKDQKTGDDFSHKQQSVGSATNGEYRVRLPDGRVQIVSYTADDNGYKANVRYDETPINQISHNYVDTNYNIQNNFKVSPTYKSNSENVNYDFGKVNYRDEIPVKENQYDSKEYYDYSAENYKNQEYYNPVSTVRPYTVSTTVAPFVPFQENYQTTSPFQQNYYTTAPPFQQNYQSTVSPFQQNYQTAAPFQPNYHTTESPFQQNYQSTVSPFQQNYYTTTAPFQQSYQSTTVKPSYDEIKHLFTTPKYNNIEVNSPSYSADNVVLIGAKSPYTDNINVLNRDVVSIPTPYVLSSLKSLNDRINTKPVLSDSFIGRLNKYLKFK